MFLGMDDEGEKKLYFNNDSLLDKEVEVKKADLNVNDIRSENIRELKRDILYSLDQRSNFIYNSINDQITEDMEPREKYEFMPEYKRDELKWVNNTEIDIKNNGISVRELEGVRLDLDDLDIEKLTELNEITTALRDMFIE